MRVGHRDREARAQLIRKRLAANKGLPDFIDDLINQAAGRPHQTFGSRDRDLRVWGHPQQHLLPAECGQRDLAMVGDINKGLDRVTRYSERRGWGDIGESKRMLIEWSTPEGLNVGKARRARIGHEQVLHFNVMTPAATQTSAVPRIEYLRFRRRHKTHAHFGEAFGTD